MSEERRRLPLGRLARSIRQRLEVNRRFGWDVPLGRRALEPGAPGLRHRAGRGKATPEERTDSTPTADSLDDTPGAVCRARGEREALLEGIRQRVEGCTACPLSRGRTRTVFGSGDPQARLMFVGEGPGYDEDRVGEPFVGKAGQLLDRMIRAMGLERGEVYIANIVKCRPPRNRTPAPEEVVSCFGYLEEQISIVRPRVIVALGATAVRGLLGGAESVTRVRGQVRRFRDIPVMPTYHPAYLLRYPEYKREVWDDLQRVMALLSGV